MLEFSKTFQKYKHLVAEIDAVVDKVKGSYPDCVRCELYCSDCCNAVFDLTLVESVYINYKFYQLIPEEVQKEILERAEPSDRKFYRIQHNARKMHIYQSKSQDEILNFLAEERIRCPFLNASETCDFYSFRPITCRVYGIPTSFGGSAHICGRSDFKEGQPYPTVNMDSIHQRLLNLSREMIEETGLEDQELHRSLAPVSTSLLQIYDEDFFRKKGSGGD